MASEYVLVDGYNVIYAWSDLKILAETNFDAARSKLQDILCNYQGYTGYTVIVVFDGHKAKGGVERIIPFHNIHVIFTKERETADQYIERVTGDLVKNHRVRVVTSDRMEQIIILGRGAERVSVRDFDKELAGMRKNIREEHTEVSERKRNPLIDNLSEEAARMLEELRLKETD